MTGRRWRERDEGLVLAGRRGPDGVVVGAGGLQPGDAGAGVGDERRGAALDAGDGLGEPVALGRGASRATRPRCRGRWRPRAGGRRGRGPARRIASAARPVQATSSLWVTSCSAMARMSSPCSRSCAARLRITRVSPYMHSPSGSQPPFPRVDPAKPDRLARADHGTAGDLEDLAGDLLPRGGPDETCLPPGWPAAPGPTASSLAWTASAPSDVLRRGRGRRSTLGPRSSNRTVTCSAESGLSSPSSSGTTSPWFSSESTWLPGGKPSRWAVGEPAVTTWVTVYGDPCARRWRPPPCRPASGRPGRPARPAGRRPAASRRGRPAGRRCPGR